MAREEKSLHAYTEANRPAAVGGFLRQFFTNSTEHNLSTRVAGLRQCARDGWHCLLRGGTILSTEDLLAHLARQLRPGRILLAGLEQPTAGVVHRAKGLRVAYLSQHADFQGDGTLWETMQEVFADLQAKAAEFADVLAWVATLANVEGIDLNEAVQAKYGRGCPGCGKMVCECDAKP